MVDPITPDEVSPAVSQAERDKVVEIFNDLIKKNWTGSRAIILQDEVVVQVCVALVVTREEIFERKLLEVQDLYENAGWKVVYRCPDRDESGDPTFTFTRNK